MVTCITHTHTHTHTHSSNNNNSVPVKRRGGVDGRREGDMSPSTREILQQGYGNSRNLSVQVLRLNQKICTAERGAEIDCGSAAREEHLMMQGRLRLRPWLEEQIKSGKYPGVVWLDETARVFQIPWKHAARHGWNIDKDATLFRNWAIHTGRYKPGIDKPDPKTWKANFRCALNSLPDVQELRDKSIKKGHNAFRVYILLPSNKTPKRRKLFRSLDPEAARVGLPALLPHTSAPLERFTEAFWKHREDCAGVVPEMFSKHGYSTFPVVKEERSTNYCCSPAANSTATQETHANTMEEHEQTEAVLKIVDHLQNLEHWSPLYEHERGWRPPNTWMESLYESVDCSGYPFQTDYHSITSQFV